MSCTQYTMNKTFLWRYRREKRRFEDESQALMKSEGKKAILIMEWNSCRRLTLKLWLSGTSTVRKRIVMALWGRNSSSARSCPTKRCCDCFHGVRLQTLSAIRMAEEKCRQITIWWSSQAEEIRKPRPRKRPAVISIEQRARSPSRAMT